MAKVTRVGVDSHVGHASPTPNPYHVTPYATGSSDVITNGQNTVRVGDVTACGDPAVGSSASVFINGRGVHRQGDITGGHGSWIPNASASGSDTVFAGDYATEDLGDDTIVYRLPPLETPEPIEGEPQAIYMTSHTPGGGGLPPRVDGGPVVAAGNSDQATENFEPGPPGDCTRKDIGSVSSKYESNGNASAIGHDSTGGWSWGAYQIATKVGTFKNYMNFLNKRYNAIYNELEGVGGNSAFTQGTDSAKAKWKELKSNPDFLQSQHDFIQVTHYDKLVAKIKGQTGLDICDGTHCNGLQDAIWSISVQHGPGSSIPKKGITAAGEGATDVQLINAIYDERDNVNKYFKSSTAAVKSSVANRFTSERSDCLSIC